MNSLYDIIEEIRRCPALHLGRLSITSLRDYLNGYQMALDKLKINENAKTLLPLPFCFFHEYVARIYNYNESTSGWRNMILEQTNHNEEDSLDIFFVLFKNFKALKIKNSYQAVLIQSNIDYYDKNAYVPYKLGGKKLNERESFYKKPIAVYCIELTDDVGYMGLIETNNKYVLLNEIYKSKDEVLLYLRKCFGNRLDWTLLVTRDFLFDKEVEF